MGGAYLYYSISLQSTVTAAFYGFCTPAGVGFAHIMVSAHHVMLRIKKLSRSFSPGASSYVVWVWCNNGLRVSEVLRNEMEKNSGEA
jgi:hypothetical protein